MTASRKHSTNGFVRTPTKPSDERCLAYRYCQCEKLGDGAHLLGNGDSGGLRTSEVDQRCKASSRRQAEGSHKGSLPNKNPEYLPLMPNGMPEAMKPAGVFRRGLSGPVVARY